MAPPAPDDDALAAAKGRRRQALLSARRALGPDALAAARAAVARHVLAGLGPEVRVVAAYEPLRTEPGSTGLLEALAAGGREVLVPITLPDRDLTWTRWSADPAAPRPDLGRDAVARAEVVLVPALAVGTDGTRLGRGGGSYDRALRRARGTTVALLHRAELGGTVPGGPLDVPVDAVVTPDGWTWLTREGGATPQRSR